MLPEVRVPVNRQGAEAGDLRLADLETFLAIARFRSISAAARSLHVTPSQVSKAVARLERQVGTRLLGRTSHGVDLSDRAQQLLPLFREVLERVRGLYGGVPAAGDSLTLAATAFLSQAFVPAIADALPTLRLRSIELPPGTASAHAGDGFFDLALTLSPERWPDTWQSVKVGELRRALFARPSLAKKLGTGILPVERVRGLPCISPIYAHSGLTIPGDDGCPLPHRDRRIGHETQTLMLALDLARRVDQLIFAQERAAQPFVERGTLVELRVQGWDVRDPLFLACHGERVPARVQRKIVALLTGLLRQ